MTIDAHLDQFKLDLVIAAHRLADPLSQFQADESSESEINLPSGHDLLIGELMMIALLFSSSDNEIAEAEIKLINEISQTIRGADSPEINGMNFMQVYREFVTNHPRIRLTLDHIPLTIHRLTKFDKEHGTRHSDDAKLLFLDFASAIVRADAEVREREKMALYNFESVLFPQRIEEETE